jgi:hypothetical protein
MTEFATGGCLCGNVRYSCADKPLMSGACHCRDCQQNTGAAFATLLIFKKDSVSVSGGSAKTYVHTGESGKFVRRSFCSDCGSPFMAEYDVTPDFRVIMAGTLDVSAIITPEWNIYTASKQPWVELSPHLKSFDGGFKRD